MALSRIEENCNIVLNYLYHLSKNQGVSDAEISEHCHLSDEQTDDCIQKLFDDGYANGGKDFTFIENKGRVFVERGGYKDYSESSSQMVSFHITGDGTVVNQNSRLENLEQTFSNTDPSQNANTNSQKSFWKKTLQVIGDNIVKIIVGVIAAIIIWYLTLKK